MKRALFPTVVQASRGLVLLCFIFRKPWLEMMARSDPIYVAFQPNSRNPALLGWPTPGGDDQSRSPEEFRCNPQRVSCRPKTLQHRSSSAEMVRTRKKRGQTFKLNEAKLACKFSHTTYNNVSDVIHDQRSVSHEQGWGPNYFCARSADLSPFMATLNRQFETIL